MLYNSVFHCHLLFAVQIWSCSHSGLVNDIFKMQKKAIRIVAGMSYNSHTEPLFKKLQVRPLPDLIKYTKIQFMHRFKQGFLPSSFNDTWTTNAEEILVKMTLNYAIMISFSLYTLILVNQTYFLFLTFRKFGRTSLMSK